MARKFDNAAYRRNLRKACEGKVLPRDYQTDIANNGDFILRDGSMRIIGRIAAGEWEAFV